MIGNEMLLFPIIFPVLAGVFFLFLKKEKQQQIYLLFTMAIETVSVFILCMTDVKTLQFWNMEKNIFIFFKTDDLSKFFACMISVIWFLAFLFSLEYMKHEQHTKRFFFFFTIVFGVLIGLCFAGNFMTLYLFYEMMTLLTLPFVIHSSTTEAMQAGYKYLGYSIFGAGLALGGFFFLNQYCQSTVFVPGGTLYMKSVSENETLLLSVFFIMILGFGCKAGMWPLHGWLPTAHPVAPSPASAVLSGIITKGGILAIIRVSYYLFGAEFLKGTWAQNGVLALAIFTIFMGSMLAYKEKLLKKRFAYSTVSQVSYVIFGLMLFSPIGFCGALLQVVFHAIAKNILFFTAGAVQYQTGKKYVEELKGIGKEMPVVFFCFTLASFSLIGIPPTAGFVSKWFLAQGALLRGYTFFDILGVCVLLVSAFLTAGYLLPIVSNAFFIKKGDFLVKQKKQTSLLMAVPLCLLFVCTVLFGIIPNGFLYSITKISNTLFAFA